MAVDEKSTEDLTQEDLQIINETFLRCAYSLCAVLLKYSNPKKYALKVFLKKTKSDQYIATVRQLYQAEKDSSNYLQSPSELNKKLAEIMKEDNGPSTIEPITALERHSLPDTYLNTRRMRDLLKCLEDAGLYERVQEKKKIKQEIHKLPGKLTSRHDTDETFGERFGGRPSGYKNTDYSVKLKKAMTKREAKDLFYKKLTESNLLQTFERFILTASFLAIRMDKRETYVAQKIGKSTNGNPLSKSNILAIRNHLLSLDDAQLSAFAAERAKLSALRRKEDNPYTLLGLFRQLR